MVSAGSVRGQRRARTSRWCACWAIAALRSARRSPRSSTRRVQLLLLRREIHGIEGARIAASLVRVVVASAVMARRGVGRATVLLGAGCPATALVAADRAAARRRIGVVAGDARGRRAAAAHSGVRRSARSGARPVAEGWSGEGRAAGSGCTPSIWKIASTHVVVDAYTNIYAPLLPLLIPQLGLSLATAGTLAMCFQMANSVSQLGFGALADRWRPRVLVIGGPLLAVIVLSFIGLADSPLTLGRRSWCSAASAARRSIRRPRRWSTSWPTTARASRCRRTSRAARSASRRRRCCSRRSSPTWACSGRRSS